MSSSPDKILDANESQLKIRSIQSRSFNTDETHKVLRASIATLQDLGFVIDKADERVGVVSGTKLDGYQLRMTISVRKLQSDKVVVRASAQYEMKPVYDPRPYQSFYFSLEKALFLQSNNVD